MTASILDQHVLARPCFDRYGLVVAIADERPVGFVHAGFGPTEDFSAISPQQGATCMLIVAPHPQQPRIEEELLVQSEDYLRRQGAGTLYGGEIFPLNPFYLGLYGGSELPGVLASDHRRRDLLERSGYAVVDRCLVLERSLSEFRPPVDRRQLQARRQYSVAELPHPPAANWWEACTLARQEFSRFELRPREGGAACGWLASWDMQPLATSWGVHAAGLAGVTILPEYRRQGLGTHLVAEALRQLQACGVGLVEVQTMADNTAALGLYRKLGFAEVDQGLVYRKGC